MAKANEIAEREKLSVEEKQILILSSLLHDIAKPETTKEEWSDKLNRFKVTSRGHEQAGEAIALDLLERIGIKEDVRIKIGKLVAEHLAHATISSLTAGKQKKSAFAKLVNRLAPANVEQLVMLMEADMLGRNNNNLDTPVSIAEFMELLEDYKNTNKGKLSFEPILTGKHLIKAGIKPGKGMGEILAKAKEAQLNLDFTDETESLEWLSNYLSTQDNDTILLEDKVKGTNMKELGVKTVISNIRTLLPKSNVELLNTLIESIKQNESSPILILAQMSREYKNGTLDKADLLAATFDKMADKNKEAIMVAIKVANKVIKYIFILGNEIHILDEISVLNIKKIQKLHAVAKIVPCAPSFGVNNKHRMILVNKATKLIIIDNDVFRWIVIPIEVASERVYSNGCNTAAARRYLMLLYVGGKINGKIQLSMLVKIHIKYTKARSIAFILNNCSWLTPSLCHL